MIQPYSRFTRTAVLYFFTIQLLLYSAAISGNGITTSSPSGAEFLKNVIGNLHKPNRKAAAAAHDRIDVEEYIPYDTPPIEQSDEINMLSKQPFNYNGQGANSPSQADSSQSQIGSLFSQLIPQFLKNEFAESQTNAVSQVAPIQFPSNPEPPSLIESLAADSSKQPDGTINGYSYYFYPLDAKGLQQLQQQQQQQQQQQNGNNQQQQQQQQNGQGTEMDATKSETQMTKPKVQPLFVAMAGFVGVAVVFLSALMFIPRFPVPILSSKGVLKRAPEELASLTKLVAESIDGKDCSERIACEVGRAMRSMQVGSKPIRMMEIILPPSVAKQLAQIRRSASRKEQCHFIMCKKTENTLKLVAKLKKTNHKTVQDVREIFNMN